MMCLVSAEPADLIEYMAVAGFNAKFFIPSRLSTLHSDIEFLEIFPLIMPVNEIEVHTNRPDYGRDLDVAISFIVRSRVSLNRLDPGHNISGQLALSKQCKQASNCS